ncbi:MAG: cyclic nucleotide-binding domain-containing protein [Rhodospirillales bacterium]|nr:cyclic nucleotide-binding domain-containing protein [Rhodospirillales bacterium]
MRSSLIFFDHLNDDDMSWIHQSSRRVELTVNDIVIDVGLTNQTIFILLKGTCKVEASDGRRLEGLSSGDIIGEVSFVDRRKTLARVIAGSNVVLASLDEATLNAKLASDPLFASRFYRGVASVLSYRLRSNLQTAIGKERNILSSTQAFEDEIDDLDLDATAKAGARLAYLIGHLREGV